MTAAEPPTPPPPDTGQSPAPSMQAAAVAPSPPPGRPGRQRPPPRARALLATWSVQMVMVLALGLPLGLVAAVAAVLHSAGGTAWLLGGIPGLTVVRPQGALLGSDFSVERIEWTGLGHGRLQVDELTWKGAQWRWWLSAALWVGVDMDALTARRVQWRTAPGSPPLTAPKRLQLPLQWRVARLAVETLDIDGFAVQGVSAEMALGGDDGREHHLRGLQWRAGRTLLSGEVLLSATPEPTFATRLQARALEGTPWQGDILARGPIDAVNVRARLRGAVTPDTPGGDKPRGAPDRAASAGPAGSLTPPSLDAEGTVHPFQPWPLGALSLSLQSLDLSTFAAGWPRTRLSGRAEIVTAGLDRPATAQVELDNARPEAWNLGGLPVRRFAVRLSAVPGHTDAVDFSQADIQLGAGNQNAGTLQGQGRWNAEALDLDIRLIELRPERLHGEAAPLLLSGPLRARLTGLPGPAALRAEQVGQTPAVRREGPALALELQTDLQGEGPALREPVRLAFDGRWVEGRLDWRRFEATAGQARAETRGMIARDPQGGWRTRSTGRMERFDPARWWPGAVDGGWRRGRHALNASWELDLALPRGTGSMPWLQWLQSLQGTGTLRLAESTLAGVGLSGQVAFGQSQARGLATVDGDVVVGRNRLRIRGQAAPSGTGDEDRWELDLDGRVLGELAPLASLHPALEPWAPRSGRLRAQLTAEGRWPRLISQGELAVSGLSTGLLSLESGEVRWRANSVDRQSGELRMDVKEMQWSRARLETLEARLDGTFARHRARLHWRAPVPLPTVVANLLALDEGRTSQGEVSVEGGWAAEPDGSGRWSGLVQRVLAAQATTGAEGNAAPWLEARDVQARVDFAAGGRLSELKIGAGRARLGPTLRLRWEDIGYRLSGERRDFELDFDFEPTEVAPVLQRAGTGLSWAGDLRMDLQGRVRAGRELRAELLVRRLGGDLMVGEEGKRQALGLSQAGMTMDVQSGVWRIAPLLAGSTLGTISGALALRTRPEARWPDGDAEISGAVQAQVNDLSIWSAWVPPGWGLSGRISTTAGVGGRLEAPEFTGELQARDIGVRNLLQGVALRDGRARIALQGDRARIEELELRAGEGSVRVSGEADIGLQPQARLRVEARQLRLLGRLDRQLTVTGDGALEARPDRLELRGRFAVDKGLIDLGAREAPTLDSDVILPAAAEDGTTAAPAAPRAPLPAASPWMQRSVLALDIDLGRQLRVRGRGVDTPLQGQLNLSAKEGRLAVNGAIDARGGTYAAYGQKLDIDRGRVVFSGAPDNPRLDLLAVRPKTDVRVGVAIAGPAQNPRVRLYSEPEMSERDKLSWLVLGRGAEGLGRTDTTVLQRAALALLSGEQEAPTDAFLRALGIDELTFSQADGDVRETVIGLGKQLGRNWYVGYERGVNATVGTWQLIYRLAQRFTLRARSGDDPALDLIWTWRFDTASEWGRSMRPAAAAPPDDAGGKGDASPTRP